VVKTLNTTDEEDTLDKLEQKIQRNEKINRTFKFPAIIHVRNVKLEDDSKKGGKIVYDSRMIYFVPEVSTQATYFFDAWLPQTSYKDEAEKILNHFEVAVMYPEPLYRPLRMGVCRKNRNFPDAHHLVLMSSEACEETIAQYDGKRVELTVLPDNEGEAALG
jgi:hypothetical protein